MAEDTENVEFSVVKIIGPEDNLGEGVEQYIELLEGTLQLLDDLRETNDLNITVAEAVEKGILTYDE